MRGLLVGPRRQGILRDGTRRANILDVRLGKSGVWSVSDSRSGEHSFQQASLLPRGFVPHACGVLQLERWRNGSVVSAGAQYEFPQTLVSFWYCKHDQNNAAGQGSYFADAVRTTAGSSTTWRVLTMLAVCSGQGSRTPGHVSSHVRRWNLLRRRGVQRSASGRGDGRGDGARDRGSPRAGNVTAADQNLFSFRHIHLLDFLPCGAQIYLGLVYRFRRHSGRCILNLPVGAEDGRTIGDRNPRRGCVVDAGRCGNSRRREPETALCRVRVGIGEVC